MTGDEKLMLRCYANLNYLLGLYEHAKAPLDETCELIDELEKRLTGEKEQR